MWFGCEWRWKLFSVLLNHHLQLRISETNQEYFRKWILRCIRPVVLQSVITRQFTGFLIQFRSPSPRNTSVEGSSNSSIKFRSIVSDTFDGQILSSVECLTCNLVSSKFWRLFYVSLYFIMAIFAKHLIDLKSNGNISRSFFADSQPRSTICYSSIGAANTDPRWRPGRVKNQVLNCFLRRF